MMACRSNLGSLCFFAFSLPSKEPYSDVYDSKSKIERRMFPRALEKVTVSWMSYAAIMFSVCVLMLREFCSKLKISER